MSKYISIYGNNPTAGKVDGTAISEGGSFTNPLSVTLDASRAETAYVKCAIRCVSGYETAGDTIIGFEGNDGKWAVAADDDYTADTAKNAVYSESLTISDSIGNTNKIIWIKASSSTDEDPQNDKSVNIRLTATIKAAEE